VPGVPLELAITGYKCPTDEVQRDGWQMAEAFARSRTPATYLDYIGTSAGEWSIAKNVYVDTRSGWFSCRTACYLAAGRPAVVQDTAWSRYLPSGAGLFAFTTMDEAVAALHRVTADAANQRKLAYGIARDYLAPDKVLPPMIDAIFAKSAKDAPRPPSLGS
jgi:hypothetical protein